MSLIESYRDAERQDIADNRRMCFKIQEIEKWKKRRTSVDIYTGGQVRQKYYR